MNSTHKAQDNYKRAKLFVIEDSIDHWLLIRKAMQQCLPEVTPVHVHGSEDALTLLREWGTQEWELPKLIIQDLYLPTREDGWSLLKQIKNLSAPCSRIPLVMLSSSNDPNDIDEAYQYGIASYMIKPTDFSGWLMYFKELRNYWWETATLPPVQFSI
ncbi:response regulator [Spirosoma koreense]